MMTWDIKPGREKSYFTFITRDFPTTLRRHGFQLTDAWYTMYGSWPQVRMAFVGDDLHELQNFLVSDGWLDLKHRLLSYIQGYHQKVVPARGWFQM